MSYGSSRKTIFFVPLPTHLFSDELLVYLSSLKQEGEDRIWIKRKNNKHLFEAYFSICKRYIRSFVDSLDKNLIKTSQEWNDYLDISDIECFSNMDFYMGNSLYELVEPSICETFCNIREEIGFKSQDVVHQYYEICQEINEFRSILKVFSRNFPDIFFEWILSG